MNDLKIRPLYCTSGAQGITRCQFVLPTQLLHQRSYAFLVPQAPASSHYLQLGAGEGWRYTMNDLKIRPPYCTPGAQGITDCGFVLGAMGYFFTYIILQTYLLTNLFVAAIMENMASGLLRAKALLTPDHLTHFQVRSADMLMADGQCSQV